MAIRSGLLFCLLLAFGICQAQPVGIPRSPASILPSDANLKVLNGLAIPVVTDTTAALSHGWDSLGMVIQIRSTGLWYKRDTNTVSGGHKWNLIASGSGGGYDSTVMQTKYRSDTSRTNIYAALGGKQPTGNYITGLSGDVGATGPGSVAATIQSNVVNNGKLTQMPGLSIKGNKLGSTANAGDLTVSDVIGMLNAITNFSGVNFLGYGTYASRPTTGTGLYFATDSTATGGWFYINGATATNLTPSVVLSVRGLGSPGDTTLFSISGSLLAGYVFNVAAQRDSAGSCIHHRVNGDGSWTWYSTCVISYAGVVFLGSGTSGSRPAASAGVGLYYNTDLKYFSYSNGTTWVQATDAQGADVVNAGNSSSIQTGTYASRPSASNCKCFYIATDSMKMYYDNGSWITIGGSSGGGGTTYNQGLGAQLMTDGGANYIHSNLTVPVSDTFWILCTGQSNAGFRASPTASSDITVNPKVFMFNRATNSFVVATPGSAPFPAASGGNIGCNIAWYVGKLIQAATGKVVCIVNYYHDSQPISSWFNAGVVQADWDSVDVYARAAGMYRVDLSIWIQGENNSATAWSPVGGSGYITVWDSVFANFRRQSYFAPTTPIVAVGMPKVWEGSTTDYQYIDTILMNIGSGHDRYVAYANTDSAQVLTSDIHYTNPGKKTIALNILGAYLTLPLRKPSTWHVGNYMSLISADSLPDPAAANEQLAIQNTKVNGVGGMTIFSENGTRQFRFLSQNGSTSLSGVYGAGENVISSENSKNIGLYTAFVKRLGISSAGIQVTGQITQTQTSSALFNNVDLIGQDNAHTWLVGGVGSTYSNSPTLVNSYTEYNLTNGPVRSISPIGQELLGINTNAITPQARLTLLGNLTAAQNGKKGIMLSQEVGTINDNTTAAAATIPLWAVNADAADTLNCNSNNDTVSSAVTRYIPGSPVTNGTAHTKLLKTFPLYVDGAQGSSSNASVFMGGGFFRDTAYRGALVQINGSIWQNKDSAVTSSAGSVMPLGIDTGTGKYVKSPGGAYTPTVTVGTNISSASGLSSSYSVNGNVVTGSVQFAFTPTAASTLSTVTVSLPLALSSFSSANYIGSGSGITISGPVISAIEATASTTTATIYFTPANTSNGNIVVNFSYSR